MRSERSDSNGRPCSQSRCATWHRYAPEYGFGHVRHGPVPLTVARQAGETALGRTQGPLICRHYALTGSTCPRQSAARDGLQVRLLCRSLGYSPKLSPGAISYFRCLAGCCHQVRTLTLPIRQGFVRWLFGLHVLERIKVLAAAAVGRSRKCSGLIAPATDAGRVYGVSGHPRQD